MYRGDSQSLGAQSLQLRDVVVVFLNILFPYGHLLGAIIAISSVNCFASQLPGLQPITTEAEFAEVIHEVTDTLVGARQSTALGRGGSNWNFRLDLRWSEDSPEAFSFVNSPRDFEIDFFGGFARYPGVTRDIVTLAACHESGHILSGYPMIAGNSTAGEGQADYFAAHTCARAVWLKNGHQNALYANLSDPRAKLLCDRAWDTLSERNLCYRTIFTAEALLTVLYKMDKPTHPGLVAAVIGHPDPNQATAMNLDYPSEQCRLDSFVNGAICTGLFDLGHVPYLDTGWVENSPEDAALSARYSCGNQPGIYNGARPRCWFNSHFQN